MRRTSSPAGRRSSGSTSATRSGSPSGAGTRYTSSSSSRSSSRTSPRTRKAAEALASAALRTGASLLPAAPRLPGAAVRGRAHRLRRRAALDGSRMYEPRRCWADGVHRRVVREHRPPGLELHRNERKHCSLGSVEVAFFWVQGKPSKHHRVLFFFFFFISIQCVFIKHRIELPLASSPYY